MPESLYRRLEQDASACDGWHQPVDRVCIGQVWTAVRVGGQTGLCMTPQSYTRTLPWSGSLSGRPAAELIRWLSSWQPFEAALAVATLNAVLVAQPQARALIDEARPLGSGNLAVFHALRDRLGPGRVGVVGRYPGLAQALVGVEHLCFERLPAGDDLPDPAAEYLLPQCQWAFVTASALANKTLPRLLRLGADSRLVLMGPSLPWSPVWQEWGVDYLAGVAVTNEAQLWQTLSEGGGVRIFEGAVEYRLLALDGSRDWCA